MKSNKLTTIHERMEILISHFCKGNKTAFGRETNTLPGVLASIIGGRKSKPSFELLERILTRYPEINAGWLLMGTNNMILGEPTLSELEEGEDAPDSVIIFSRSISAEEMDEYNRRREEEWAHYIEQEKKHENDRIVLRALIDHLVKTDASGEVAQIQALLPSALSSLPTPDGTLKSTLRDIDDEDYN